MHRDDDEPNGSGGRRMLVPLVVVGAAVVVLSTAAEGQARFTPFGTGEPQQLGLSPAPAPTGVAPPKPAGAGFPVSSVLLTVVTVLACIVALVIAAVLIRLIVAAIRDRRRRHRLKAFSADGAGTEPEVADAPAVLRGIAAALQALEEHREPSDAVVQAWLGLQQAAEDAGFARGAAETPTEFTGRVLSRTGADRVALRTLLRLYLRARFGDGAITDDDATAAGDALRALEASWQLETASRG